MDIGDIWPYNSWRAGQREIAEAVRDSALEGNHLMVGYPTGAGKTAAALTGALAASLRGGFKVVYLVRARTQFQAPLRELKTITKRIQLDAVFLQNKRDLCLVRGVQLLPYDEFLRFCSELVRSGLCPYHRRASEVSVSLEGLLSPRELLARASEAGACPYELARRALSTADVIVAAYNYIFDPEIRRAFLSDLGTGLSEVLLIVDEAHNLPSAVISVLSKEITSRRVRAARREVSRYCRGGECEKVERDLYSLYSFMSKLRRAVERRGEIEVERGDLIEVAPNPDDLMRIAAVVESRVGRATAIRSVASFLKAVARHKPGYTLVAEPMDGDVALRNLCVSPAGEAGAVFQGVKSAILMSGTLPPRDYMVSMLGLEEGRVRELRIPLPWARRVKVMVMKGVSSRYVERGTATYGLMAHVIDELYMHLRRGVALVVAPSYDMAKAIRAYLRARPLFMEREDTKLEDVISAAQRYEKLLVLCVAWGKLVEGIELRSDGLSLIRLVVLAGLPVPEPNLLNRQLVEVLKYKVGDSDAAWRLVYMIPAAVRVAQAIGRSVRSERDYAAVAILDERVLDPYLSKYLATFGYSVEAANGVKELLSKYIEFARAMEEGG